MKRKYVIIGGSAAGPKTASKIRRLDQSAEITMVQMGAYMSMASCGYPYYVGGVFEDRNKLISTPTGVTRDASFFKKVKDIRALVRTEAVSIDREKKKVQIKNLDSGAEDELEYDRLILATGANPVKPPIPGIDLEGVTTLQSMEDADFLKSIAAEKKIEHAVVVGGGLIGIETCEALQLSGIKVTIVEMLGQILPFLDWEMARLVEKHITAKGAVVKTGNAVKEFKGKDGKLTGVVLDNGEEIETSLAVFSIGVRPNSRIAAEAGLAIGQKKGIKVNKFLQTSDPFIYAAGDCIETTNIITGEKVHWPMGDAANLQGRVAAQNAVLGNRTEYPGMVGTGICKVFDFGAGSTGLSETMARKEGYTNLLTALHAAPDKPGFMGAKPVYTKLVADKTTGRLLGAQCIGPGDVSKRVAVAAMALHGRMCVNDLVTLDLPYAPPFSSAIDNFITAAHVLENKWLGRMKGISATEVKQKLDAGEDMLLLDMRGPDEFEQMRLGVGETLLPLGKLRTSLEQLPEDKNTEIIIYCKISLRGYEGACFLEELGYSNVRVMEGGVISWPFDREK